MNIEIRKYTENDLTAMTEIWNEVVEDGIAFPQEELLTDKTCRDFFDSQTYCGVAEDTDSGRIMGLYILHPNNVDGAVISATQAMQCARKQGVCT